MLRNFPQAQATPEADPFQSPGLPEREPETAGRPSAGPRRPAASVPPVHLASAMRAVAECAARPRPARARARRLAFEEGGKL